MLEVSNLSKKYKGTDTYTLKDVEFSIKSGEVVGLIGKNGTGKTTLMKLIAKSIRPTSGDILLNKHSIFGKTNQLKNVAFLISPIYLEHLTALENVKQYKRINQLGASESEIEELMTLLDIWRVKDKIVRTFSLGMKQRLSVAMTLLGNPKLLLLDEPFVGLDPSGTEEMINFLKKRTQSKEFTLLVSSHQLSELEGLCDRYLYVDNGTISNKKNLSQSILHILLHAPQDVQFPGVTRIDEQHYAIPTDSTHLNQVLGSFGGSNQIKNVYVTTSKDEISRLFKGVK